MKLFKKFVFLFFILLNQRGLADNASSPSKALIIGSKTFGESLVLAEILAIILEEKFDKKVIRKHGLGGTNVAFEALKIGAIDVYAEYTGTGHIAILKGGNLKDPEEIYNYVQREFNKRFDISWSKTLGFNNTYALAVKGDDKKFSEINKISELETIAKNLRFGGAYEFMERKDGYQNMAKFYRLDFSPEKVISMQAGLLYSAIENDQVDVIVTYSTDGRIKKFDLKLLKDDRNYFPPYYVSYIAKNKSLKKSIALRDAIRLTEGLIPESEMVAMNDQVDRLKQEPYVVARDFLIQKGIIESNSVKNLKEKGARENTSVTLLEYFYNKRYYVFKLFKEHLALSLFALVCGICFSLPLGVILTRFKKIRKVIFPILNTIQTIPSLALLGFLIPLIGIGFNSALFALFLYSLLPLVRNTYAGIRGVDRSYVESSRGVGLTELQILLKVEIPLAMPVILAGIRTATAILIGTATLAALIGAGGFGDPIFRGVATVNSRLILLGALPAAFLAIFVDKLIEFSEVFLVSKGIRLKKRD